MLSNGLRRLVATIHLLSTLLVLMLAALFIIAGGRQLTPAASLLLITVLVLHSSVAAVLYSGRAWPTLRDLLNAILNRDDPTKEDAAHANDR